MVKLYKAPSVRNSWLISLVLAVVLFFGIYGIYHYSDLLSIEQLTIREQELRHWQENHLIQATGLSFLIYIVVTGISFPGATGLTVVMAWLLGFWVALPLISFASTLGASIAFLGCRFLFGELLRKKISHKWEQQIRVVEKEGAYYLFALRLFPGVPFFAINLIMGMTKIRLRTFWWVSQAGMLPGTIVYVYFGDSLPSLSQLMEQGISGLLSWRLLLSLILLGIFPITIKRLHSRFGKACRQT